MRRISDFLVNKRLVAFVLSLLLALAGVFLFLSTEVNTDMTKYLPESSPMRKGLALMRENFPDEAAPSSLRLMFRNLKAEEKQALRASLAALPSVTSVDYAENDARYNKEEKTLFVLHSQSAYGSEAFSALRQRIEKDFAAYDMLLRSNEAPKTEVSTLLLSIAMGILIIILFVMSKSWIEPLLFLFLIGISILINLGTNYFLGYVSDITMAIAPILQVVLSMDYAILLMSRYREERAKQKDSRQALLSALKRSYASVLASALTTIVGLLALMFMGFQIGKEMGIVLAKGVFISMICVFTILPTLIICFDGLMEKTKKSAPNFLMKKFPQLSYKMRFIMPFVFVALLVSFFFIKNNTNVIFTENIADPLADSFPKENRLLLLYNEKDEQAAQAVADEFSKDENVYALSAYANTLGKKQTVEEMAKSIKALGGQLPLDETLLKLVYGAYFDIKEEELASIYFADFLNEIAHSDKAEGLHITDTQKAQAEQFLKLSQKEEITSEKNAKALAAFFGIEEQDVKNALLLYFSQHMEGLSLPPRSLLEFFGFLQEAFKENAELAQRIPQDVQGRLAHMEGFLDKDALLKARSYEEMAEYVHIPKERAMLLYALSLSQDPGYVLKEQSLLQLRPALQFLFALQEQREGKRPENADMLLLFSDKETAEKHFSAKELSSLLRIEQEQAELLCALCNKEALLGKKMSVADFFEKLEEGEASGAQNAKEGFGLSQLIAFVKDETPKTAQELSENLHIDRRLVELLLQRKGGREALLSMTAYDFLADMADFVQSEDGKALVDEKTAQFFVQNKKLFKLVKSDAQLDIDGFAGLIGMRKEEMELLFAHFFRQDFKESRATLKQVLKNYDLLVKGLKEEEKQKFLYLKTLVEQSDHPLSYQAIASVLQMPQDTAKLLYCLTQVQEGAGEKAVRLSFKDIAALLANGQMLRLTAEEKKEAALAAALAEGSLQGTKYSPAALAELLSLEESEIAPLFLMQALREDAPGFTLSPKALVDFLSDSEGVPAAQGLLSAKRIMDAALSETPLTAGEMRRIFPENSIEEGSISLLYRLFAAEHLVGDMHTISMYDVLSYMNDVFIKDALFRPYISKEAEEAVLSAKAQMDEAYRQLTNNGLSRMLIQSAYPVESKETLDFVSGIKALAEKNFSEPYYLVGESAMVHEMHEAFPHEFMVVSIITAAAIFLVVLISFRSLVIPVLLVLLVQLGVFITISVIGLQGFSAYYLALLIVQSILMGATIDYAIIFCHYYRESRQGRDILPALEHAFSGTVHTIMTSGLILILVTFLLGHFVQVRTIAEVCTTISIGALSTVLLILWVLPSMVVLLDRWIAKKPKQDRA